MPSTADIITRMLTDRETATKNAQALADHWKAVADGQRLQLDAYRRQYGALHRAARAVVETIERDDNNVTPDTAAAVRELARCVSSKEGDMP